MSDQYHAIVIGGGHNGLTCAAYLARAGKHVLVLEAADRLGGAAITRAFAPGFNVSACAHILHQMPRGLARDLRLKRHGLTYATKSLPTTLLSEQDSPVTLSGTKSTGLSAADAAAYAGFMKRMRRFAAHLRPMLDRPPPRLGSGAWADNSALLQLAWQIRSLGRTDMRELLRIIGMNVYDLAEEHFESPSLRAAVAFDAVLGTNFGPRAPGTVLTLLYRLAAESGAGAAAQPQGGIGAVTTALAESARALGVEIRTGVRVARVLVRDDRAAGVVLADGSSIAAGTVISNADPRTTFLRLLGPEYLDTGFVRRVNHFRQRGLAAKLHIALSGPPSFHGVDAAALRGRLILAPTLDYLENAFNPTKYGAFAAAPAMEILLPTTFDATLAPAGRHVLSAIVQYAPYAHDEGWEQVRDAFVERIIETLSVYAPDLRGLVEAVELLTPADIEAEFGIEGGHWHHGELAFDQFFMVRPVPGATQYESPVADFFLCGAGAHPGGGVMGVAGRNAACQVLKKAA
jgi:phytoene dehydrogenase-like protein